MHTMPSANYFSDPEHTINKMLIIYTSFHFSYFGCLIKLLDTVCLICVALGDMPFIIKQGAGTCLVIDFLTNNKIEIDYKKNIHINQYYLLFIYFCK